MRNLTIEGQLRRELDLVLVRLEERGRAALIDACSEGERLGGDMFSDAQVVASRNLDEVSYERLSRQAKVLANALERVRDGSYGTCEACGGTIPQARRRALTGVTTCVKCQELGERLGARPPTTDRIPRRSRVRDKTDGPDEGGI